jgi:hypothetical protein
MSNTFWSRLAERWTMPHKLTVVVKSCCSMAPTSGGLLLLRLSHSSGEMERPGCNSTNTNMNTSTRSLHQCLLAKILGPASLSNASSELRDKQAAHQARASAPIRTAHSIPRTQCHTETSAHPNSRPPSGRSCPPSGFQELPPEPSCPQVLRLPHSPQHVRQPRSRGGPNPHLNSTASETDCKTMKAHPTTHDTQLIASDNSCDPDFLCPLKVEHLVCAVS